MTRPPLFSRPGSRISLLISSSALGGYAYRSYATPDKESKLNPRNFVPFTLESKSAVSSTSSIFTLWHHDLQDTKSIQDVWRKGIWSVQAKQPQLQIARSYTPLPETSIRKDAQSAEAETENTLRLLIRKEKGGEMSNYLHKLPDHSTVELRGPHLELEIEENVKEVLFLAGGTGIAPAMQVAALLARRLEEKADDDNDSVKMHILWANRNREDSRNIPSQIPASEPTSRIARWLSVFVSGEDGIRKEEHSGPLQENGVITELESLSRRFKSTNSMTVEYFVDGDRTFIETRNILNALQSSFSANNPASGNNVQSALATADRRRLILISGPDGFIEHWAGRKVWVDGKEIQGNIGGQLSRLNLRGWSIWKL